MSTYTPDRWVILEITNGTEIIRKVLASWYGGFAGSDSWKLSSGIIDTKEFDNYYEFYNASGSTYTCYKDSKGMSGFTQGTLAKFKEQETDELKIKVEE